ncbi:pollen-specific leucine-rich repeat extensin-like protein 2 [Delphinapterus leucas]|uniref:Pollen-specific leucine-rich repeat extensin-like protein 2 n=1 Tax=Delphinapterus leucas TaxID=9749 RepID=A0A2Y9QBU4_DELLE|nr:pollen-specific leucine-rich repeat extensin-like protein 2 [Delphinapterus leucas]
MARRGRVLRAPPPASPHPPWKRTEPGARRPAEPALSPQPPAPRQVPPARARIRPVSWAGFPILFPPRGWGNGAVALTWLVRGGLDGHGSGARGGTGSPEKNRLFGRGAGESGRQAALSPVSEAAPWTPTRSFSAAARPPSHYPPPSSAAAAAAASSTSSSAETPRPLHTLSHHAAGEPLPPTRHFRAQVARSGPGAGNAGGTS